MASNFTTESLLIQKKKDFLTMVHMIGAKPQTSEIFVCLSSYVMGVVSPLHVLT